MHIDAEPDQQHEHNTARRDCQNRRETYNRGGILAVQEVLTHLI